MYLFVCSFVRLFVCVCPFCVMSLFDCLVACLLSLASFLSVYCVCLVCVCLGLFVCACVCSCCFVCVFVCVRVYVVVCLCV